MVIERNALKESLFRKVTVHKSSITDAVKMFGNEYRVFEHNSFSREHRYASFGLSFFYKIADSKQTIFIIKIYQPFASKTSDGLKVGESTLIDVFSAFKSHGKFQRNPVSDPLAYFAYDSIAFGFNLSENGMLGLFDLEVEANKEIEMIKLF
ncbi:hypothetical protein [Hymenobacter sp.]|uniref:hypothetical protein n=1 Tax=Hymenobacter sp. TaxID=1898978 RepID=UPI00286B439A|nr:hypothetical protein [Hymenobacter sp.]